jgi:uncharacterized lipoprotein YajG|tara:strand:+ start:150 stop:353 length:204 start_codon:yes stop_codon:yes gene_type:complete
MGETNIKYLMLVSLYIFIVIIGEFIMKKLIIICATILFLAGCSLSGLDLKVDEANTDKASATVEKEK